MQSTEQDSGSRVGSGMPNLRQREVRINSKHLGHSLGILGSKSVERESGLKTWFARNPPANYARISKAENMSWAKNVSNVSNVSHTTKS